MNTIAIILLNLVFAFNGFVCSKAVTDVRDNDPLPDSRPEKLSINYTLGGGMRYYSESMFISLDSCVYTVNDEGAISKIYFKITPEEFDKLYEVFTDNKFHKIKTYHEQVYDRGGESISISWGNGKSASVDDGGMTFIEKNWVNEWTACLGALKDFAAKEIDKQKKDYEVRIDKTLFGKTMSVYINNVPLIPQSTVMAESELEKYITRTAKILPGAHKMSVSWDKKYENVTIDTDNSKGINLYLKNDTLFSYSYIK
jgi:hypothetical protein